MSARAYEFVLLRRGEEAGRHDIVALDLKDARARMGAYVILYAPGCDYRCVAVYPAGREVKEVGDGR